MADDRMLSDEILLGLIKANSGGGGGGTNNYNNLENQPQINGTTLSGNKTASDLGLVAAETGKGLSSNDYTDADKAIVGGVTAALAGKQGTLTAGDYISIDVNNEITVNREIPNVSASYEIKTTSTSDPEINTDVIKRVNGEIVWTQDYNYQTVRDNPVTIDDVFVLSYSGQWKYKLLVASDDHAAGYEQTWGWSAWVDYTENFSLIDNTGKKLIIKEELDTAIGAIKDGQTIDSFADVETALSGKQATLTFDDVPTDGSNNPVKSNGVYDALATKQDATDNSLDTTAKTIVGAINEVKGDADSLMSGLTNYQAQNNLNLEVPDRKNIAGYTLDDLKSANTEGTWNNNVYTVNGVSFTCDISNGFVTSITADSNGQTVQNQANLRILSSGYMPNIYGGMLLNGCNSNNNKIFLAAFYSNNGTSLAGEKAQFDGTDAVISNNYSYIRFGITINDGVIVNNVAFYPMIRPATITDPTFAPYIPSVDARLEKVESGKVNVVTYNMGGGQTVNITHVGIVAIMSDRGGLYTDGIANRGLNDLVPSTQITVTHVDAAHVTVTNNSQYGTSILVLSDGDITITSV